MTQSKRIAVELKIGQSDLDAILRICTTLHISWEKWLGEALDSGMRRKMTQDWETIRARNLKAVPSPIDPADEATLTAQGDYVERNGSLFPEGPAAADQAS